MATFEAKIEVRGLKELDRTLARLPDVVEEAITRKALEACGELIRLAAVNNIHSRSGRTAADIRAEVQQPKRDQGVVAVGGTFQGTTGRACVLRWLEFGTRAHKIVAGTQGRRDLRRALRALRVVSRLGHSARVQQELLARAAGIRRANREGGIRFKRGLKLGGGVFRASANHPGTVSQSPLTRALFENGERALKVYGETIWDGIKRAVPVIRAGG
jgi:HK97 gp10 family phage protein